jgi:tetratricopeptide (TPR) repeat protein
MLNVNSLISIYLLFMLFLLNTETVAQQNSNSLKKVSYNSRTRFTDSSTIYIDSAKRVAGKNPLKAVSIINKAIEWSIRSNNPVHESQALLLLGNIQLNLEQYSLAADNFSKSVRAVSHSNLQSTKKKTDKYSTNKDRSLPQHTELIFEARKQWAVALNKLKRYDEANQQLNICFGSAFNTISETQKREALRILAQIKSNQGNSKQAYAILTEVLQQERADKNSKAEVETLLAIGDYYTQEGNETKAGDYYVQARDLALRFRDSDLSIKANNALAKNYRVQGNVTAEVEARNSNISLNQKSNNLQAIQKENLEIGKAYLNSNDMDLAEAYLKKSIEIGNTFSSVAGDISGGVTKSDQPPQMFSKSLEFQEGANAYKQLAEGFLNKNELSKARQYFKLYAQMQDSVGEIRSREMKDALLLSSSLGKNQQRIELLEKERELTNKSVEILKQDQVLKEQELSSRNLIIGLLGFFMLSMIATAFYLMRTNQARRKADKLLALQSLGGQMNPHFIFNALNSVNEYISRNDEREANRYLSGFSKLMRQVMESSRHLFIPLNEEIEMLKLYMQLEHARFRDKFEYTLWVDEELDDSDYVLPPMIIQPYLENAVWHGLRYRESKGNLSIRFEHDALGMAVIINDNGIGMSKSCSIKTQNQKKQTSLGMQNIETRVRIVNELYNAGIKINISECDPGAENPGTQVKIFIPQLKSYVESNNH